MPTRQTCSYISGETMRGLYIHIPFCERKCTYCDFYSLETTHLMGAFLDTLEQEIRLRAAVLPEEQRQCSTLFLGGGTPSLMSPAQLERLLGVVKEYFTFTPDAEWTMECNPGTVTKESLAGYRALGINRLSFGVQSFFADDLAFLTRIHSPEEAREAVALARAAGFDNINIDLIFALPGQTMERWQTNLATAVALGTEHISAYSLIFEEGTPLNAMRLRGEVHEAAEDLDAAMYEYTMNFFAARGYRQYEVSNFARPGRECAHNLLYWQGREYVSFGPSAHGYIDNVRYWNARSLSRYTAEIEAGRLPVVNSEHIAGTTRLFERAFLELRSEGIDLAAFHADFGVDLVQVLDPLLRKVSGEDLVMLRDGRLVLTSKGFLLCDAITTDVIALLEQHSGEDWTQERPATDAATVEVQKEVTPVQLTLS